MRPDRPDSADRPSAPRSRGRAGFSLLETQVAFVMLGIGLAGVCPLVVMQLKLSRKVATGVNPQTSYFRAGATSYVVPTSDAWARKLGVAGSIRSEAPQPPQPSSPLKAKYGVTILAPPERTLDADSVTLHVQITQGSP